MKITEFVIDLPLSNTLESLQKITNKISEHVTEVSFKEENVKSEKNCLYEALKKSFEEWVLPEEEIQLFLTIISFPDTSDVWLDYMTKELREELESMNYDSEQQPSLYDNMMDIEEESFSRSIEENEKLHISADKFISMNLDVYFS